MCTQQPFLDHYNKQVNRFTGLLFESTDRDNCIHSKNAVSRY